MPEITDAELRQFVRYQNFGTPDEVTKKLNDLESDNRKYRQETIPALEAKVPKDDETVVKKSQAEALKKYEVLGKPEDVKKGLEDGAKGIETAGKLGLKLTASAYAKAVGLAEDAVETLVAIPEFKEAKFEVRAGKVKQANGTEVDGQIGYVTLAGENQKEMTHAEALERVPALKGLRTAEAVKPAGMPYVPQSGAGGSKGGTIYDQIREEQKAKLEAEKNALTQRSPEDRLGLRRTQ